MLRKIFATLVAFGPSGVFLLSAIDSVIPLPATMDALLILVAVKTPHRAYFTAFMAVLGSALGNVVLFLGARSGMRRLLRPPKPGSSQRFRTWFHRYGMLTVFIPAATPVLPLPLKFFIVTAAGFHTPFARVLGIVVLARIVRYFGEAYLGIKLGEGAQAFITRNAWSIVGVILAIALILYVLLYTAGRRSDRMR